MCVLHIISLNSHSQLYFYSEENRGERETKCLIENPAAGKCGVRHKMQADQIPELQFSWFVMLIFKCWDWWPPWSFCSLNYSGYFYLSWISINCLCHCYLRQTWDASLGFLTGGNGLAVWVQLRPKCFLGKQVLLLCPRLRLILSKGGRAVN